MVRNIARLSVGVSAVVLLSGSLYAQTPRVQYDPAAETTVKGTIVAVETREGTGGLDLVLLVDASGEELRVYAGPVMFVANSNVYYRCQDELTIIGTKVKFEDGSWMLAREISKGGKRLELRDSKGVPMWTSTAADVK